MCLWLGGTNGIATSAFTCIKYARDAFDVFFLFRIKLIHILGFQEVRGQTRHGSTRFLLQ